MCVGTGPKQNCVQPRDVPFDCGCKTCLCFFYDIHKTKVENVVAAWCFEHLWKLFLSIFHSQIPTNMFELVWIVLTCFDRSFKQIRKADWLLWIHNLKIYTLNVTLSMIWKKTYATYLYTCGNAIFHSPTPRGFFSASEAGPWVWEKIGKATWNTVEPHLGDNLKHDIVIWCKLISVIRTRYVINKW